MCVNIRKRHIPLTICKNYAITHTEIIIAVKWRCILWLVSVIGFLSIFFFFIPLVWKTKIDVVRWHEIIVVKYSSSTWDYCFKNFILFNQNFNLISDSNQKYINFQTIWLIKGHQNDFSVLWHIRVSNMWPNVPLCSFFVTKQKKKKKNIIILQVNSLLLLGKK